MHKERVHRARRVVLCAALLVPWGQTSHATDSMLYARAIGDPYLPAPTVDSPAPPENPPRVPRARDNSIPDLPGLGTAPPDTQPAAAPIPEGWSWTRILIGVGIVVAISAIASKGGGSSGGGDSSAPPSTSPPPSGGGGSTPPPSGGGGGVASPTPEPAPAPAPTPNPPSGGGDDDDEDDDDKKKGKGRRILIPAFSASF